MEDYLKVMVFGLTFGFAYGASIKFVDYLYDLDISRYFKRKDYNVKKNTFDDVLNEMMERCRNKKKFNKVIREIQEQFDLSEYDKVSVRSKDCQRQPQTQEQNRDFTKLFKDLK